MYSLKATSGASVGSEVDVGIEVDFPDSPLLYTLLSALELLNAIFNSI